MFTSERSPERPTRWRIGGSVYNVLDGHYITDVAQRQIVATVAPLAAAERIVREHNALVNLFEVTTDDTRQWDYSRQERLLRDALGLAPTTEKSNE